MTLWIALLVGISATGITWLVVSSQISRRQVATRLSEVPGNLSFPYSIYDTPNLRTKKGSVESMNRNKLVQDLFLAGIRDVRGIQFFSLLLKLSFIVPVALIAAYIIMGSYQIKDLIVIAAAGVIFFFYMRLWVRILKLKRQHRILKCLPQFLDLIVVCVEAGLSFTSAIERILKEEDPKEPLIQEFKMMYYEYLGGLPLASACERMDKRCGLPDLSVILGAAVQSDQMGASLGNSLRMQSVDLRDKLRQRIRAKAFQTPVRILFPMTLIFFAFILTNLGYIGFQLRNVISSNVPSKTASTHLGT